MIRVVLSLLLLLALALHGAPRAAASAGPRARPVPTRSQAAMPPALLSTAPGLPCLRPLDPPPEDLAAPAAGAPGPALRGSLPKAPRAQAARARRPLSHHVCTARPRGPPSFLA